MVCCDEPKYKQKCHCFFPWLPEFSVGFWTTWLGRTWQRAIPVIFWYQTGGVVLKFYQLLWHMFFVHNKGPVLWGYSYSGLYGKTSLKWCTFLIWRCIEGKGFCELKYLKGQLKLPLSYSNGPFKMSWTNSPHGRVIKVFWGVSHCTVLTVGMWKGCHSLWKVYERVTFSVPNGIEKVNGLDLAAYCLPCKTLLGTYWETASAHIVTVVRILQKGGAFDQHSFFPCNISIFSSRHVMRFKKIINYSVLFCTGKFSKGHVLNWTGDDLHVNCLKCDSIVTSTMWQNHLSTWVWSLQIRS